MLILVTGLPGTGKTYFATALAKSIKAFHLNSDGVRKDLGKMGKYDKSTKQLVYKVLKQRTETALREHKKVIVDATFYKKQQRSDFISLALKTNHSFVIFELKADEGIIKERTEKSRPDSEANFAVYKKIKKQYDPIELNHFTLWSEKDNLKAILRKAKKILGL